MKYDICLIGAGPIGIECAVELKKRNVRYLHLDAGQIGATIEWYAPGTTFFSSPDRISIAGVPLFTALQAKATREEYLLYLRSVVAQFELEIQTYSPVSRVEKKESGFKVHYAPNHVEHEEVVECSRVILACGDMHEANRIGVPGEDLSHVSHYLREPHKYFQRRVLIVGGKNSAIEAAIRLQRVGADVTLSYRGAELDSKRIKFWLYPELQYLIREKKIRYIPESAITKIQERDVLLQVKKHQKEEELQIPVDDVLLLTGYVQDKSLFRSIGIPLEGESEKPKLNSETMETSVPGVFVIGTAVAGTQAGGVKEYIETSHEHVDKLVSYLFGDELPTRKVNSDFLEN